MVQYGRGLFRGLQRVLYSKKQRYNKVLYRLPVAVVESLATLVGNIGNYQGREYQELKKRVLAAHGRSRWEKLDSLLPFPKMGANEQPSVVLSRLNSLKPATLEELYMAIFLRVLPDSYREHFAHCELRTAEELAAKADGLWEMRGGAVPLWPPSRTLPPLAGPRWATGSKTAAAAAAAVAVGTAAATTGAVVAAVAGATAAAAVDSGETGPPHLGEPCSATAAAAASSPPTVAIYMMGPSRGPASASTTTAMAAKPPDASHHASFLRGTGRPPAAIEPIADSGRRLPSPASHN
jgi:hypothetical protein